MGEAKGVIKRVLSVSLRNVWVVSGQRFRRTLGGVHLFVWVGPTDAPAAVVRVFTGRAARVFRQELAYLRNFGKVLWSQAYFAASVGYVSATTVRRCIEHRRDAVPAS